MEYSDYVAGILSVILMLILNNYIWMKWIQVQKIGNTLPKRIIDCKTLKSNLLACYKNGDADLVRAAYEKYLDNCFENDAIEREKLKKQFESFLDSFLSDGEVETEQITRRNTRGNKSSSASSSLADENFDSLLNLLKWFHERKNGKNRRRKVQINSEPEIKFIERRKRRKVKKIIQEE